MDITICFIGDIMLGRDIDTPYNGNTFDSKFKHESPQESIFNNTLPILSKCDLLVGNLETAITDHNEKYDKMFNYRINPMYTNLLKINDKMFLSIANNHILDYNERGMYDTIKNLQKFDIKFSGAGSNLSNARSHATFEIKGKRIGIISCADHYDYWKAGSDKPGIYYLDYQDYTNILKHIERIKKSLDILILSIHWGPNYQRGIDVKQERFAKDAIKAGVTIIYGHSAHHIKCIRHNGKQIIMYSMGDFIDDYAIDSDYRNDLGMIVKVIINPENSMKVNIIPTRIDNRMVTLAKYEDK